MLKLKLLFVFVCLCAVEAQHDHHGHGHRGHHFHQQPSLPKRVQAPPPPLATNEDRITVLSRNITEILERINVLEDLTRQAAPPENTTEETEPQPAEGEDQVEFLQQKLSQAWTKLQKLEAKNSINEIWERLIAMEGRIFYLEHAEIMRQYLHENPDRNYHNFTKGNGTEGLEGQDTNRTVGIKERYHYNHHRHPSFIHSSSFIYPHFGGGVNDSSVAQWHYHRNRFMHTFHNHHPNFNFPDQDKNKSGESEDDDDNSEEVFESAICNVRPNRALPPMKRRDIKGKITLHQKGNNKLVMILKLRGLMPPGMSHGDHHSSSHHGHHTMDHSMHTHQHGFHVHELSDLSNGCDSTGAHFNPFNKTHGPPNNRNSHRGDFGNIACDDKGETDVTVEYKIEKPLTGEHSLIGRALVIHELQDDLGSNPNDKGSITTGNAGSRLACCIIVRGK